MSPNRPALLYEKVTVSETGSPLLRDMLFSPDQQHIYTLTDKQVRFTHTHIHTHTHRCTHTHTHRCTNTHTSTHAQVHRHTHIYALSFMLTVAIPNFSFILLSIFS